MIHSFKIKRRLWHALVWALLFGSFSVHAQISNNNIEELAEKAEAFYPSNLDSSIIVANQVIARIRDIGINSSLEEKMLDLKGWANRRKGETDLSEKFFFESIKLSKSRNNLDQLGSTYNRLGLLYSRIGRLDEALDSFQKSLELRTQSADERGVAGTLNNLGNLYYNMGDKEKAYNNYSESIKIREQMGDQTYLSSALLNMGNWLAGEANYDEALSYYTKYKGIQAEIADTSGLARVATNMGNIYNEQGNYEKALELYLESISLSQKAGLNNETSKALVFLNIGSIYFRTGYLEKAIQNYKKALQIYIRFQDLDGKGSAYQNIGRVFEDTQDPDSALFYYQLAIAEYEQLKNPNSLAKIYQNIGVLYTNPGSAEFALTYLQPAADFFQEKNDTKSLANVYNNIGASYFYLSQFNEAIDSYKKSLENAGKSKNLDIQRRAAFGLAETYGVLKDYENAFKYQQLYDVYEDSLLNLERVKVIEELITKYETEKVEAENEFLLLEQAQNEAVIERRNAENKLLIIGLMSLFGAVVGIIFWSVYSARKKRIIATQKEEIYQKEIDSLLDKQEIESIEAMLEGQDKERKRLAAELHDRLGSILSLVKLYFSSLNEDIKEKQPDLYNHFEEGNRFLDDAFGEVRALIKEMQEGKTSGNGLEKDVNELLAKISKIGVLIQSQIDLNSSLAPHVEMNVFRIIQEALSNALKYSKADKIELLLSSGDSLSLNIRDNGIGFDSSEQISGSTERESYGVGNMENRVKLLGGNFDLNTSIGKGVDIKIEIPINRTEDMVSEETIN